MLQPAESPDVPHATSIIRFKEGMEEAQRLERIAKRYNSSSNQTADDKGEEKVDLLGCGSSDL